ncbi:ATP-sensitive inward rectifier potassium channel 10 [Callorhinchus milii]|uniref:ATP-sensitive inward rectifier potassium channel 10-like n=1 Tax=Callorhinchus milii TaxID=7868 RepID=V9KJP9_CALMI|nr:ATP-sensitive inward rectifier potassium channel 10 [Callorhinchus milii]|eukprot:gi/632986854/ref/XP_007910470.1/ PREDICTED: ATP-sensitive inward rectifier potassium channel 10-like [Callorhinchus milii]
MQPHPTDNQPLLRGMNERLRVIRKDGKSNVKMENVVDKPWLYLKDLWTTLIDIPWRYKLAIFSATFVGTWFAFGTIWFLVAWLHGDLVDSQISSNHTLCVVNMQSLTASFLFSLESQTTIGYGFRYISEECPLAIILLVAQLVLTSVLEIFLTGTLLAKLSRPKKRASTVRFSHFAVVGEDQGKVYLMFRVANVRRSLLIGCEVRAKLIRTSVSTNELSIRQLDVEFGVDSSNTNSPFLLLPMTFYHLIDEKSPFREVALGAEEQEFELVVVLCGTVEPTSSTCQIRTSYLPQEILWGHQFHPLFSVSPRGKLVANFANFDLTVRAVTSHAILDMLKENQEKEKEPRSRNVRISNV